MKTILKVVTLAAILFSANSVFATQKQDKNGVLLEDGTLEEKEGHKQPEVQEAKTANVGGENDARTEEVANFRQFQRKSLPNRNGTLPLNDQPSDVPPKCKLDGTC